MEKGTRLQNREDRENMLCSMVLWRRHGGYCHKLTAATAAVIRHVLQMKRRETC